MMLAISSRVTQGVMLNSNPEGASGGLDLTLGVHQRRRGACRRWRTRLQYGGCATSSRVGVRDDVMNDCTPDSLRHPVVYAAAPALPCMAHLHTHRAPPDVLVAATVCVALEERRRGRWGDARAPTSIAAVERDLGVIRCGSTVGLRTASD